MAASESDSAAPETVQATTPSPPPTVAVEGHGKVDDRMPRDTTDVGEAVERLIRAIRKRGVAGDIEALTALRKIEGQIRPEIMLCVDGLHRGHGYTWAEIGQAAGITKQAAEQRWGL